MKKILLLTAAIASLSIGVSSCDMDLHPPGVIDINNAFQTFEDGNKLREGMYMGFRGSQGGAYTAYPDYMSDLLHATISFGNRGNVYYNWHWTASDGDITSIWASPYSYLKDVNNFIASAPKAMAEMSEENAAATRVYLGEAYFFRAYYHYCLADRFCVNYANSANPKADFGIPYMTSYNPSSNATTYPDRGTLEGTYAKILEDLDSASVMITTPGSKGSMRITADAVKALKSRIALNMGNYEEVIANATEIINSGVYPFATDTALFNNIWYVENGEESIVQLPASYSAGEGGTSYQPYSYVGYNPQKDIYTPDYLPTVKLLNLYEKDRDYRYLAHYKDVVVTLSGNETFNVTILYKFVGNPELKDPSSLGHSGVNKAKPFRVSEQYLNLAEAYARNGQSEEARTTLNALRQARNASEYTGNDILSEILNERYRELIGEGFYISDAKRFNVGISRGEAQDPGALFNSALNTNFNIPAGNYRFVWPIPAEELDSNPQMRDQQNPEY